ncbi:unnamed protein product, partial [Anisakis simplex]|uniref:Clathrin light chain n=1 Tax=Anisakis simplex TaxID=6269 RepID=A0A0M3JL23_ANISI
MDKSEADEEANNTDDDVLSSDLDRLIEEGMDEISPGSEGSPISEAEEEKLIGDEIEKTLMHEFGEDSADIITTTIPNYELPSSINPSPLPVTSTATPFTDDGTVNIVDQAIYSTASFNEQNAEISDDEFNAVTTEKTPAATNDELDLQDSEVGTT